MSLSDHPWMEHSLTHARAQLPDIPYWRANGWDPCEGPYPEVDNTKEQHPAPAPKAKRPAAGPAPSESVKE